MAGQGTIGLEIMEQVPDVDAVIVPVGGGGLIAGVAIAVKSLNPKVKIIVGFIELVCFMFTLVCRVSSLKIVRRSRRVEGRESLPSFLCSRRLLMDCRYRLSVIMHSTLRMTLSTKWFERNFFLEI